VTDCYVCKEELSDPLPREAAVFNDPECPHCVSDDEVLNRPAEAIARMHVAHQECFRLWAAARGYPLPAIQGRM
jgi:hypothetical protein